MTNRPFRRRQDISHDDRLDAWLNSRMSGSAEMTNEPEGESLAGAADAFHAWADDAQGRDPAAKGPADDLWNRILNEQRRDAPKRRSADMDTTIHAPVADRVPPQSNRTKRVQQVTPASRSGAWFNAIAAALLLLSIGGGAYLAGNGGFGFGGGGGNEGRYAAQLVSPEASSDGGNEVCDVEPLTTDEIIAHVENPMAYLADRPVEGTPGVPSENDVTQAELVEGWAPLPHYPSDRAGGEVPEEETFAEIEAVASSYLACIHVGTVAQVLSFLTPQEIQDIVIQNLPVYRTEESVREFIDSVRDERYGTMNPWLSVMAPDLWREEQLVFVNTDRLDARVAQGAKVEGLHDADMFAYIGHEFRDENGNVTGLTSWDGTPLEGNLDATNGGTAMIFVHSETLDRWFYHGVIAPRG